MSSGTIRQGPPDYTVSGTLNGVAWIADWRWHPGAVSMAGPAIAGSWLLRVPYPLLLIRAPEWDGVDDQDAWRAKMEPSIADAFLREGTAPKE